ncbi:hypothetical protein BLTE_24270 [Blastochloris tepida]|uniref:DUF2442 domain-containing protein n=1 Tax=Blastochloris tepida TaxID=2233851 RepID=A0A348G2F9_9HYPH|nr:hypothetical protein BLTE_24270 [Blastochloris tepida]
MTVSPINVRFDAGMMWVELSDGRTLGVPLAWFPRLLHASREQRAEVEISRNGLHWDVLDEDISVAGLLAGRAGTTTAGVPPSPARAALAGDDRHPLPARRPGRDGGCGSPGSAIEGLQNGNTNRLQLPGRASIVHHAIGHDKWSERHC